MRGNAKGVGLETPRGEHSLDGIWGLGLSWDPGPGIALLDLMAGNTVFTWGSSRNRMERQIRGRLVDCEVNHHGETGRRSGRACPGSPCKVRGRALTRSKCQPPNLGLSPNRRKRRQVTEGQRTE